MPNWCSNNLMFRHADRAKLEAAHKAFMEGKFCEHFVPLPNGEWNYGFCVENWGTKWEVDGESSYEGDTVTCRFDSAWSPPIDVYKAMCAQGFEVEATYHEPGMCFVGRVIGNEEEFDDDYREYNGETASTVRDVVGEDLDDEYGISEGLQSWEEEQENLEIDLDGGLSAINEGHDDDEAIDLDDVKLPPHTD